MPRLPSGREIGADPTPLRELLKGAARGFNAHHIMAIDSAEDLLGWLEMLALDAAEPPAGGSWTGASSPTSRRGALPIGRRWRRSSR